MTKIEEMCPRMVISKITEYLSNNMEADISVLKITYFDALYYNKEQPGTLLQILKITALANFGDSDCKFKVRVVWNCNSAELERIFGFTVINDKEQA